MSVQRSWQFLDNCHDIACNNLHGRHHSSVIIEDLIFLILDAAVVVQPIDDIHIDQMMWGDGLVNDDNHMLTKNVIFTKR